ncbi:MAG: hypothetical protein ACO20H_05825 [Bacteriovoracaceae bacterium]
MKYIFLIFFYSIAAIASPPKDLDSWGVFSNDEGVFKITKTHHIYKLNTPLFSDYAQKIRTIHIPQGKKIQVFKKEFIFPVGTIISKTFYYDPDQIGKEEGIDGPWGKQKYLIETRILQKGNDGWTPFVYQWDMNTRSAYYWPYGNKKELKYKEEEFSYFIPDKNQCMSCHVSFKDFDKIIKPLGPSSILNFNFKNQIIRFKKLGLMAENINPPTEAFPIWNEPQTGDLEARAKAYLHTNCAHCHSPDGPAANTGLYLEYKRKNSRKRGFCKTPVAPGIGSGGRPFAIFPGKPKESILTFRVRSRKLAIMMPEIGRDLTHKEGVDLVGKWIESLPGDCH